MSQFGKPPLSAYTGEERVTKLFQVSAFTLMQRCSIAATVFGNPLEWAGETQPLLALTEISKLEARP